MNLPEAVRVVRSSVAAVMRISKGEAEGVFSVSMAGTAWCVADSRYFLTAQHILNNGQPRQTGDRFFLFLVPDNGEQAFHLPVSGFLLEDAVNDLCILEVPQDAGRVRAEILTVSFDEVEDGSPVLTCGFPAAEIIKGNVDPLGNWLGGQLFLKSHANTGIVSAQYGRGDGVLLYELNVGWHHGESGGPICRLEPSPAVFSVMQHYRNITSPHGVVAGPHRGVALSVIKEQLLALGATVS